jgi:hypothetical protein
MWIGVWLKIEAVANNVKRTKTMRQLTASLVGSALGPMWELSCRDLSRFSFLGAARAEDQACIFAMAEI